MGRKAKRAKTTNRKKIFLTFIEIILILIIIYSARKIFIWWQDNRQNKDILEEISDAITIVEETNNPEDNGENDGETEFKYSVDFETLKSKNKDIVGWLKVYGTEIEFPVVQYTDNDFYLTHSLDKSKNSAGWIFMDYRNKRDGTDKNTIIYGHNRRDGSMFASLKNVLKEEWYENVQNRLVTFITENETSTYEVFSVYQVKDEDYYITTNFKNNEFENWLKKIKSRSVKDFGVNVTANDQVLTLSTCPDNNAYRVVLHAKKIK